MKTGFLVVVALALTFPASAQWSKVPNRALSRSRTGEVNMTAPAPKRAGKPDLSIVATPEGAKATSTLLTMQNKTTAQGDPIHWEGGYEDTLVKTAKGWRFKSRVHVWPEVKWTDRPQDMPARSLTTE